MTHDGDSNGQRTARLALLLVVGLAVVVIAVVVGLVLLQPRPEQPKPPPWAGGAAPDGGPEGVPGAMGWTPDPEAVKAVSGTLEFPTFSDTPAGRIGDDLPAKAYLWDADVKLYGTVPPPQNQNPVGSCVSFGTSRAMERSLANAIVRDNAPYKFRRFREEVIYAVSRVDIGGGRIGGDGSVGAWAAKGATDVGHLPEGTYGSHDLTKYDPTRCRQWGSRGVPADLKPELAKFKTGSTTQIKSWQEAKKALAQGYGIAVCSNQGFSMQRDANGVCRASGSWAHCVALDGYHTEGGKEYGHIENSWGPDAHRGPVGWGEPSTAGFWADGATVDRMLKQNDSWAFSAVKGFPARRLDWSRANPRRDRPDVFARPDAFALAH